MRWGLILWGAWLFMHAPNPVVDSAETSTTQVIIIGAGASGISAAKQLYEDGIEFIVLEAEPR